MLFEELFKGGLIWKIHPQNNFIDGFSRLAQLKQDYGPYKAQDDVNLLLAVLPKLSEYLRIAQLCKGIRLTIEGIRKLFNGEIVSVTGKLHFPEHDRDSSVKDAKLQLFREQDNPDKFRLSLNG